MAITIPPSSSSSAPTAPPSTLLSTGCKVYLRAQGQGRSSCARASLELCAPQILHLPHWLLALWRLAERQPVRRLRGRAARRDDDTCAPPLSGGPKSAAKGEWGKQEKV